MTSSFGHLLDVQLCQLKNNVLQAHTNELKAQAVGQDLQRGLAFQTAEVSSGSSSRLECRRSAVSVDNRGSIVSTPGGLEAEPKELGLLPKDNSNGTDDSGNIATGVALSPVSDSSPGGGAGRRPNITSMEKEQLESFLPARIFKHQGTGTLPSDGQEWASEDDCSLGRVGRFMSLVPQAMAPTQPPALLGYLSEPAPSQRGFEVKPCWRGFLEHRASDHDIIFARSKTTCSQIFCQDEEEEDAMESENRCRRFLQRNMAMPNSFKRLCWDLFGLLLIAYDFVWIPLLAFDPAASTFSLGMEWIAKVFWLFDIGTTFVTGYVTEDGELEMRLGKVARHYTRTWLTFDVLLVTCDWAETLIAAASSVSDAARFSKLSRTFRMLRMIRLARVLRLNRSFSQVVDWLTDCILTERVVLLLNIAKSTLYLMVFAHIIACLWFKIGTSGEDEAHSWVYQHGYDERMISQQYVVSIHWAMTNFIGAMEVRCWSTEERLFAVAALLACFVLAAAFVSTITTSMTRLDFLDKEHHTHLATLRRYLWAQGVSAKLALRITRNAQHATKERRLNVSEANVSMLSLISDPLRIELHFEVHSKILCTHPIFVVYSAESPMAMRQVCHKAIQIVTASKGDVLFSAGERPENAAMLFPIRGEWRYTREFADVEQLHPRQWACEMVLWTDWMHRGVLQARTDCLMLELDAVKFNDTLKNFFAACEIDVCPARYAEWYVDELNDLDIEDLSDLDLGIGLNQPFEQAYSRCMNTTTPTRQMSMPMKSLRVSQLGLIPHS